MRKILKTREVRTEGENPQAEDVAETETEIARARRRLVEARSDTYDGPPLETCIALCLQYALHDRWIATEMFAYEASHPVLVEIIRRGRAVSG
jgi:hypothetical protein